eukprot:gene9471-1677_t
MNKRQTLLFSVGHSPGQLQKLLKVFNQQQINLKMIRSRPSRTKKNFEIIVDLDNELSTKELASLKSELKQYTSTFEVLGSNTPWFPRKLSDLDRFGNKVLEAGADLESDHPGFNDAEYRKRRSIISENAQNYKHGDEVPRVDYTKAETEAWGLIYKKLTAMYPEYACKQLNYVFPLLEENCGYSETNIPQLADISNFLKDATGFTIRPVAGLLSSRDFLNGLAFRVFHSTQYIRHHSRPFYTPEPDIIHELLGHVPLFADPDFADFSQIIGLASIGASDEAIEQLARCYWFTVEFGVCLEEGKRKAYGAGLLSSFGELEHAMSDKPKFIPFAPEVAAKQDYPITTYQPIYFVAESFEDAKIRMKEFSNKLEKPIAIRFNPYTDRIELLDSKKKLENLANSISSSLDTLQMGIKKLNDFSTD